MLTTVSALEIPACFGKVAISLLLIHGGEINDANSSLRLLCSQFIYMVALGSRQVHGSSIAEGVRATKTNTGHPAIVLGRERPMVTTAVGEGEPT